MSILPMAVLASAWWLLSAAVTFGWTGDEDDKDSLRYRRARDSQRIAAPLSIVLWIAVVVVVLT